MSLIIPPELHRAFKTACAAEGKEMTEVILQFLEKYVEAKLPSAVKKAGRR